MQSILDAIHGGTTMLEPHDAARIAYDTDAPTRAQLVSVRRAMHRLEQQGLISIGGLTATMASRPQWIYAAPVPTDEQRQRDEQLDKRLSGMLAAAGSGTYRRVHPFTCAQCGRSFKVDCISVGRRMTYCSSACRQRAYRERTR